MIISRGKFFAAGWKRTYAHSIVALMGATGLCLAADAASAAEARGPMIPTPTELLSAGTADVPASTVSQKEIILQDKMKKFLETTGASGNVDATAAVPAEVSDDPLAAPMEGDVVEDSPEIKALLEEIEAAKEILKENEDNIIKLQGQKGTRSIEGKLAQYGKVVEGTRIQITNLEKQVEKLRDAARAVDLTGSVFDVLARGLNDPEQLKAALDGSTDEATPAMMAGPLAQLAGSVYAQMDTLIEQRAGAIVNLEEARELRDTYNALRQKGILQQLGAMSPATIVGLLDAAPAGSKALSFEQVVTKLGQDKLNTLRDLVNGVTDGTNGRRDQAVDIPNSRAPFCLEFGNLAMYDRDVLARLFRLNRIKCGTGEAPVAHYISMLAPAIVNTIFAEDATLVRAYNVLTKLASKVRDDTQGNYGYPAIGMAPMHLHAFFGQFQVADIPEVLNVLERAYEDRLGVNLGRVMNVGGLTGLRNAMQGASIRAYNSQDNDLREIREEDRTMGGGD